MTFLSVSRFSSRMIMAAHYLVSATSLQRPRASLPADTVALFGS
jgi:hypothetical protein